LEERVAGDCWDAAEVGQLAEGVDPDELAHLVIATMEGMILLAKVSDSDIGAVPRGNPPRHRLLPGQSLWRLTDAGHRINRPLSSPGRGKSGRHRAAPIRSSDGVHSSSA
jgi:hypothetical protein